MRINQNVVSTQINQTTVSSQSNSSVSDKEKTARNEANNTNNKYSGELDAFIATKPATAQAIKPKNSYNEEQDGAAANESLAQIKSASQEDYTSLLNAHSSFNAQNVASLLA